jgi:Ca2+-binding RTX toxin-like protein
MKNNNLEQAVQWASASLCKFASKPSFWQNFEVAFGSDYDRYQADMVRQEAINRTLMLPIRVLNDEVMGIAVGAFAATTSTIYLRDSFVRAGDVQEIGAVIVEELGHSIDARVNQQETPGDEGAIFRLLIGGCNILAHLLVELRSEDDWGTILVDGQELMVEMMVPTEGDDLLIGGVGYDNIIALAGNDTINAGLGSNSVDGGDGNDLLIIDYSRGNYMNLFPPTGISSYVYKNPIGGVLYGNFSAYNTVSKTYDSVAFGSIERFKIVGTNTDDFIVTWDGNDSINGAKGNDTIDNNYGVDIIDGGEGTDTLTFADFSKSTKALTINETGATIKLANGATVYNIEYYQNLTMGSGWQRE